MLVYALTNRNNMLMVKQVQVLGTSLFLFNEFGDSKRIKI